MSDSGDHRLRAAWTKQTDQSWEIDMAHLEVNLQRRQAEIAKRDRTLYLSAAIIGPAWAAAIWLRPDLRLAAVPGLFIAVWLTWQMYQRSAARLSSASSELPCLDFQRAVLQRELDLVRSSPKWNLMPLAVGQVAIVATLMTNPRFTASPFFYQGVALFAGTAGAALVIWWRRWQRQALELQGELDALGALRQK